MAKTQFNLWRSPTARCDFGRLVRLNSIDWRAVFLDSNANDDWNSWATEMSRLGITTTAGGVNPGDRRAIFYMVHVLRPNSVLEVGTHIGSSTVAIAAAQQSSARRRGTTGHRLITVDIEDVNDSVRKPWARVGSALSPADLVRRVGCEDSVEFVVAASLRYLRETKHRFDLVFLDGDHSAAAVYQELAAATEILNPNGLVLLHDYYPDLRPLWPGGDSIPGPFMGSARVKREAPDIVVRPLGELPWVTKSGQRFTSLAVVGR